MAERLIGVIGSASPSSRGYDLAFEVGQRVAHAGYALICGGLGGVMEAASRGCSESGGTVIGLLPGGEAASGNPYLTYALPTNLGHARNILIAHAASGLIAIEGEYGTLSEVAVALKLGRPVVGLESPWQVPGLQRADHPEQALLMLLSCLEGHS